MKFQNRILFLIIPLFLIMPTYIVSAQGIVPCGNGGDAANACTLCHLIVGIYNIVTFGRNLLITVAAVGIFIAGFMYVISGGSEDLLNKSKSFLRASLTGFVVTLMAWFFVAITMWVISAQKDLGIGQPRWDLSGGKIDYTCDTTSTSGSGAMGNVSSGNINCDCTNGSLIPFYYPKVGDTFKVYNETECKTACKNKGAKYYSFDDDWMQMKSVD